MVPLNLDQYLDASDKTVSFLLTLINKDGLFSCAETSSDPKFYYKLPMLLVNSGNLQAAQQVLDAIQNTFLADDGDIRLSRDVKTDDDVLSSFECYMNGWIALAALSAQRYDLSNRLLSFCFKTYHTGTGGFVTSSKTLSNEQTIDVLMTAHMGYIALVNGDRDMAHSAGNCLLRFISLQPDSSKFYLRRRLDGSLITDFPAESGVFHVVDSAMPNQLYFMIGYPVAFLTKLYLAAGENHYLDGAKTIFEFSGRCHPSIYSFHFSHKLAWGTALLASVTKEARYMNFSRQVADFLCTLQNEDGMFLASAPASDKYDQSVEIAIWLRYIHAELRHFEN